MRNLPSHFTNHHQRFFFIYVKTQDEFCTPDLQLRRLEEVLHVHLRELNYRRILFFNGRQKLYFFNFNPKR